MTNFDNLLSTPAFAPFAEAAVAALLSRTGRFAGEAREPSHL